MSTLVTLAVVAFVVAQFTPKGQAFLASGPGAATAVGVAALAILSMLPGSLAGDPGSVLFSAIWGYVAWQRAGVAGAYAKGQLARAKRLLRLPRR